MVSSMERESSSHMIQSVDRAMTILQYLAQHGESSVGRIATVLNVHKSTASRLLATLEHHRLVQQRHLRGSYRLGVGVMRLANTVMREFDLLEYTKPYSHWLSAETAETVNIAILQRNTVLHIDQVIGSASIVTVNWVGQETAIHASSTGKVLLAYLSPKRLDVFRKHKLQALTPQTIATWRELSQDLELTRSRGYAITIDELEEGLAGIAAPIFDSSGEVIASICISGPSYRFVNRQIELAELVVRAADDISYQLGYIEEEHY